MIFINGNPFRQNQRICIDINHEVKIGPSPWEKHLAKKAEEAKLAEEAKKQVKEVKLLTYSE